jgi:hypothetical protein
VNTDDNAVCADCGEQLPEGAGKEGLVTTSFRWRLTRKRLPDGGYVLEWRCPACWRKRKASLSRAQESSASVWPSQAPPRPSTPPKADG